MSKLAGEPDRRQDLGEKGYDAFCRLWSAEQHMKGYFHLISEAARRKFGASEWEKGEWDMAADVQHCHPERSEGSVFGLTGEMPAEGCPKRA
jgi:hypothetical protein